MRRFGTLAAAAALAAACTSTGATTSTLDVTPALPSSATSTSSSTTVPSRLETGPPIDVDFAFAWPAENRRVPVGWTYRVAGPDLNIDGPDFQDSIRLVLFPLLSPQPVTGGSLEAWLVEYYGAGRGPAEEGGSIELERTIPVTLGSLNGVLIQMHITYPEEGESFEQWNAAAVAADGDYVYLVGCGFAAEAVTLDAFIPHCVDLLGTLQVPFVVSEPEAPQLAGGWSIEPGELLITGLEGLTAYNIDTGESRAISTIPIPAAYYAETQLVFQGAARGWAVGDTFGGPSSAPIWRRLGPLGAADLIYDPGPFARADLHGIFDVGDGPGALIRLHASQNDDLWVVQPFDGGPWREIGLLTGGEVVPLCTAWTGTDLLQAVNAEGTTWVSRWSPSGEWSAFLPSGEQTWEGASCVAVSGEQVFVLFQPWGGGQANLVTTDLDGSVLQEVAIDAQVEGASYVDVDATGTVVVTTFGGEIFLVDPSSGAATLLPVTGDRAVFAD